MVGLDHDGGLGMENRLDAADNLLESNVTVTLALCNDVGEVGSWGKAVLDEAVDGLFHSFKGDGETGRKVIGNIIADSESPVATVVWMEAVEWMDVETMVTCMSLKELIPVA